MTKENFILELEKIYKTTFKNSGFNASYGCFGKDTLFIRLYLANDKAEVSNGYFENDMFNIMLVIRFKDEELKNMDFEKCYTSYHLKADNEYMCYSSKVVAFRKVNGDYTKVLKAFDKFVGRLHESLLEDIKADKIHDNFKELLRAKI